MLIILVYFLSGGRVDDVVKNQTNHKFTSVIREQSMKSARVCWTIGRTVFNVYLYLNRNGDMNASNLKSVMKIQDMKGCFFLNLDNFYI